MPGNVYAALVLATRGDLVLAAPRRGYPRAFGLPGGKVEPGETPAEAAARELFEETGYLVAPGELQEVFRRPFPQGDVVTLRALDLPEPPEPVDPREGVPAWVTWSTLLSGPFEAYNRRLRDAIYGSRSHKEPG